MAQGPTRVWRGTPRRPTSRAARPLRAGLAAVAAAGVLLALLTAPAAADPGYPSAQDVQDSVDHEAGARLDVGRIEARLAAAGARTDRLAADAGRAVEAYNGARVRLAQSVQRARSAQQRADESLAAVSTSREALGRFAAAAYRSGGDVSGLSTFLVADGPRDLISRVAALQSIGDSRRRALDDVRAAQVHADLMQQRADRLVVARKRAAQRVREAKEEAQARLAAQRTAVSQIADQRERLVRALAAARNTTVALERERQAGIERAREEAARKAAEAKARAEARARAEAAARAAAEKRRQDAAEAARLAEQQRRADEQRREEEADPGAGSSGGSGGGGSGGGSDSSGGSGGGGSSGGNAGGSTPAPQPDPPDPPAPQDPPAGSSSGTANGAERAIDFARAQIGKPYEWAADGPSSYDCSGLTMRAWEQGGVYLPHYSVAQYEQSAKVPLTELRRGDLVFFASNPNDHDTIYHVGLYMGDGQMIEAPYTGEDVRVSSIWRSSLFGAARP